jgi:hypothetical protein
LREGARLMRARVIGAAMAAWLVSQPAAAIDLTPAMAKMYDDLSIGYPTDAYMTVCYGFNCRRRFELIFTEADRKRLTELLAAGKKSAEDERKAVQQAVLWFDRRVGPIIGTDKRVARADVRAFADRHNFDCFDTTRNTNSLLLILQAWGLLKHHTVSDPRFRGYAIFFQLPHNTAVLTDRATKVDWAVDMWTRAYAELPDVMPVEQWLTED